MDGLTGQIAASIAFVGSHFAMSHPLRKPLVGMLGERAFGGVFALVSLVTFGWMIHQFRAAPPGTPLWDGQGDVLWILASVLTIVALVLFAGSLRGNPALPSLGAQGAAAKQPHGVFRVTRHPMMWGFALWALAHVLVVPTPRSLVLSATIAFLALVGARAQDAKKEVLMGAAWSGWESRTSYWPRLSALPGAGVVLWLVALAAWLAITWAHLPLAGMAAGVWRWVG